MHREKLWWGLFSDCGVIVRISDLLLLNLRKLACIHVFIETVGDGRVGGGGDGFGGDVELGVVSVEVEVENMVAYDVAKGEQVEDEAEGAEKWTLGDTLIDWGFVGLGFVDLLMLAFILL